MTVVDSEPRPAAATPSRPWPARLWGAPLWAHLLALGIVLVALLPVVGDDAVFSADEGAAAVQARSLAEENGWIVPHPAPQLDPDGSNYPFHLSSEGSKGAAPFGKHPLYALMLAAADRVAGFAGMMMLSALGTVVAAGLAAVLARRLDPALSRPALWVVALASPLLFDGFVVIAHTLGAAAGAAAVVLAVLALERRSVVLAVVVAPAMALALLLRNEAAIFALALGLVLAVIAARRRELVAVVASAAALLGAAAAYVGDRLWSQAIVGGNMGVGGGIPARGSGVLAGRLRGLFTTWLRPDYGGPLRLSVVLLSMLVAVVMGAMVVRRHPDDHRSVLFWSAVAAAAAVAGLVMSPTNLVPGLLVAFPIAAAGFVLVRRSSLQSQVAKIAAGTFVVFAVGVIATQYARGGTAEWGGRYFALGLPVIVPVLLFAIRDGGRRLDAPLRRVAAASLVVCSLAMAAMAVGTLRSKHQFTDRLVTAINRAGSEVGRSDPVFVTTHPLVPRAMWETVPGQRWLLSVDGDLGSVVQRLEAAGVSRFVFVSKTLDEDRAGLAGTTEISSTFGGAGSAGWKVLVLTTG